MATFTLRDLCRNGTVVAELWPNPCAAGLTTRSATPVMPGIPLPASRRTRYALVVAFLKQLQQTPERLQCCLHLCDKHRTGLAAHVCKSLLKRLNLPV